MHTLSRFVGLVYRFCDYGALVFRAGITLSASCILQQRFRMCEAIWLLTAQRITENDIIYIDIIHIYVA